MQKKGDEGNINEKINNTLTANLNEKKNHISHQDWMQNTCDILEKMNDYKCLQEVNEFYKQ